MTEYKEKHQNLSDAYDDIVNRMLVQHKVSYVLYIYLIKSDFYNTAFVFHIHANEGTTVKTVTVFP